MIVTDVLQFVVLTAAVLIVVPLALAKTGGVNGFVNKAPEGFFNLYTDTYPPAFLVAFGLYNLCFIAGNWAYVQRYTSVSTPKDAQKVGWLFGGLYMISPLIWMLPPMAYRVLNPGLEGLADEGAYLLMCKAVLPVGMLGLMLGGMVFATASSVNTTLNISAGVLANDLYRQLRPKASNKALVNVGKASTVALGLLTIIIALLVPYFGGIVEVVMSVAALTGGAMFLPPLWSLFSKYQTGKSVFGVTLVSLLVNAFFKFLAPAIIQVKLGRTEEMILGVGLPVVLLIATELYFWLKQIPPHAWQAYQNILAQKPSQPFASSEGNQKGGRVIGLGVCATSVLIIGLSLWAGQHTLLVATMGVGVGILGSITVYYHR